MDEPGRRVLGDRYELDSLIASGGMGEVWRGRDALLGRPVAVKLLRSEYTGDPTFLARFRAEATHAAALSHPNIAAVYDYGEVTSEGDGEHLAYLVMELVEGAPLSTLLREEGPLSPEATMSVLRQTAVALAEAHHVGLVHRDVKPGNILVGPDEQVKITDFGIAWSAGSVPLTEAGQVLGTPQYLSPEIAVGQQPSPASDVYSLGLVGYECLTGEPAFDGDNPVSVALKQVNEEPEPLPDDLPAGLRELVDEAVAKDPGERPPDGDAFVAALDRVRAGRPLEDRAGTRAVPLVERPAIARRRPPAGPARSRRRLRTVLPVVCALLAGVAAVLGFGLLRDGSGDQPSAGTATEQQQTIELDGQDYVGRPVDDVALQLTALGLTVDRQAQSAPDVAPGQVTQLDPLGRTLYAGDAVTVFFAEGAPADGAPAPVGDAPAAGETGAAVPPTQAQDTGTTPDTAPDTAPATPGTPGATAATESDPAGSSPTDAGSTGTAPTEAAPSEASPSDAAPTESAPTEAAPTESAPTETAPTESAPTDAVPSESAAPSSDPGSTAPTSPAPTSSEAAPTSSAAASSTAGSSSAVPPGDGQGSAPGTGWPGRGGRVGG